MHGINPNIEILLRIKSEIRISKSEVNYNFEFRICFEFRISYFVLIVYFIILNTGLTAANTNTKQYQYQSRLSKGLHNLAAISTNAATVSFKSPMSHISIFLIKESIQENSFIIHLPYDPTL